MAKRGKKSKNQNKSKNKPNITRYYKFDSAIEDILQLLKDYNFYNMSSDQKKLFFDKYQFVFKQLEKEYNNTLSLLKSYLNNNNVTNFDKSILTNKDLSSKIAFERATKQYPDARFTRERLTDSIATLLDHLDQVRDVFMELGENKEVLYDIALIGNDASKSINDQKIQHVTLSLSDLRNQKNLQNQSMLRFRKGELQIQLLTDELSGIEDLLDENGEVLTVGNMIKYVREQVDRRMQETAGQAEMQEDIFAAGELSANSKGRYGWLYQFYQGFKNDPNYIAKFENLSTTAGADSAFMQQKAIKLQESQYDQYISIASLQNILTSSRTYLNEWRSTMQQELNINTNEQSWQNEVVEAVKSSAVFQEYVIPEIFSSAAFDW